MGVVPESNCEYYLEAVKSRGYTSVWSFCDSDCNAPELTRCFAHCGDLNPYVNPQRNLVLNMSYCVTPSNQNKTEALQSVGLLEVSTFFFF